MVSPGPPSGQVFSAQVFPNENFLEGVETGFQVHLDFGREFLLSEARSHYVAQTDFGFMIHCLIFHMLRL